MQLPNWFYVVIYVGLMIGAIAFIAWGLGSILDDLFAIRVQKKFEEDLRLAIKHSQPSWEQLADIAVSRNVRNAQMFLILQRLMREILTGRDTDIAPHQSVIEGYIAKLKEIEPFEGIPTEIRIHLERIREQLAQGPLLLQPLTSQIRELLSVNEKDKRQQKYYTVGGFFVGFLGLIFAAFAYFYPYTYNTPTPTANTATQDTPAPKEGGAKLSNPAVKGTLRDKAASRPSP